ncbi:MAG: SDR family NAD(P)-dependent oxidoreductase [Clostridia bacterium]|nr:SDR family NAD(P)-dependent oxidoreductase [Clostridia bacterium]MDE7328514.1 SDR family NAD(P)-dependent oxidoreductase [Clostridia bacterium]
MVKKAVAIVTGANSGIGKEFARLLAEEREIIEVWAIAQDVARLEELKEKVGEKIRIFSMDLTECENIALIGNLAQGEDVDLRYLVNCAGYAKFCDYSALDYIQSLKMIDLNIGATVAMCSICIPCMTDGARIINMASQAAFQPVPYQNIYSSTKAFVRNYTRALNVELKNKGVTATAVCPGWMKTRLIQRAYVDGEKGTNTFPHIVEPKPVAQKALNDAKAGKDTSVYSAYVKFSHLLSKLLPQRLLMKIWLKQQDLDN